MAKQLASAAPSAVICSMKQETQHAKKSWVQCRKPAPPTVRPRCLHKKPHSCHSAAGLTAPLGGRHAVNLQTSARLATPPPLSAAPYQCSVATGNPVGQLRRMCAAA